MNTVIRPSAVALVRFEFGLRMTVIHVCLTNYMYHCTWLSIALISAAGSEDAPDGDEDEGDSHLPLLPSFNKVLELCQPRSVRPVVPVVPGDVNINDRVMPLRPCQLQRTAIHPGVLVRHSDQGEYCCVKFVIFQDMLLVMMFSG